MRNVTQYPWSLQGAVVTVLLVLAASGYTAEQTASNGYANPALLVTTHQVAAHLQDSTWRLVDVRSSERPRRIPGAVNVDWVNNLTAPPRVFKTDADLARLYQQARVTPDKEIVVYCRTGMRASHDYFVLRLLGYPRVRLYDGSYVEWAANATVPVAR